MSYSGFVNNEDESVLTGGLEFDCEYVKGNNIGTYAITPKGLASSNYEIVFTNGTLTVTKTEGLLVSAPTLSGVPTKTSITVNAVDAPGDGLSVEYAISTSSDGTGLSNWQTETTFAGLVDNTTYYVYARSAENDIYSAGQAVASQGITTRDPNIGMDGTISKPFKVYDVATLGYVGKESANPSEFSDWTRTSHYVQIADITLPIVAEGESNHVAIASTISNDQSLMFAGSYDGGGFTVSNLTINQPTADAQGLFGALGTTGVVKNVGLINMSVTGQQCAGGVVGINRGGTISDCYVIGNVTSVMNCAGGIAGTSFNVIKNCRTIGNSTIIGTDYVGGIVGSASGVQNCSTGGDVRVIGNYSVGGIAGYNQNNPIENCYAECKVTGSNADSGSAYGGIVGESKQDILNCYATGEVVGNSHVGGLAGMQQAGYSVSSCYATGNVSGNKLLGGLIGTLAPNASLTNSYATGDIIGKAGGYAAGGLVAGHDYNSKIQNCYATGSVSGIVPIGGLSGKSNQSTDYVSLSFCFALNPEITAIGKYSSYTIGRVRGVAGQRESENYAWDKMVINTTGVSWSGEKTPDGKDGEDISTKDIKSKISWKEQYFYFEDQGGPWIWDDTGVNMPWIGIGEPQPWPEHLQ